MASYAFAAKKVVKVAHINMITGRLAAIGAQNVIAWKIAVDEINKSGGIKSLGGSLLKVRSYDCESNPPKTLSATMQAISDGNDILVANHAWQYNCMAAIERANAVCLDVLTLVSAN